MSFEKPIRQVAIVGTGVIDASWAAQYLARGLDVVATDPAPGAEAKLRKYVDDAWGVLTTIGLTPAGRARLGPPPPRPPPPPPPRRPPLLPPRHEAGAGAGRPGPGKRTRAPG